MIVWLIILVVILVLAAVGVALWLRRRARRPSGDRQLAAAWQDCRAARGEREAWWLVLGPVAAGKSSLLAESGVSWQVRPPPGPATAPRPWRHEGGCLVELPGAWAESAAADPGWTWVLGRLRRERRPPSGLVACVPLSELLRRGPAYAGAVAAALRARTAELAAATGHALPLYLVLTKADHIGGYKDFFAGLAEVERQEVLGVTLPWPSSEPPARQWAAEHRALVDALRARRPLGLLRARDGEAARKLLQFPSQLEGLGQNVGELIAHLAGPGRESCVLRGIYLTSCHRAAPVAPPPTRRGERTDLERSVYLGQGRAVAATGGTGHFSHALITRVLTGDRATSRPTRDRRRIQRRLRIAALWVAPAAAAVAAAWLLADAARISGHCTAVRSAVAEVRAAERLHAGDAPRNLDAVDRLGSALAALAAGGPGAASSALRAAADCWSRRVGELCGDAAVRSLGEEIARLRAAPRPDVDRLYDAFRAYRMLAGTVPPDPVLLERELTADRRWFRALERDGSRLDWPTEVLARRQLDRLGRDLLPHGLAACTVDAQLADATARDLGEALWIRQGWEEILREAEAQFSTPPRPVEAAVLHAGPEPSGALRRRAWDEAVEDLIDEKSVAIERTLRALSVRLDRDAVRRRLGERFRIEHRRAWLRTIAEARAAPADSPAALPARIAEVAGPSSPWPALVQRALDEIDPPSALASLGGASRAPWARPSLDPLLELRRDVEGFLAADPAGRPAGDLDRVAALAARFDEAATAAGNRLAEVQPDDLRDALRSGVAGQVRGLWQAVDRSAVACLEQGWRARVAAAWRRDCQGRFPFSPVGEEVAMERFAAFANPRTGVLWQGMAPIERLRAQRVAGRPALTLSRGYLDMAARAASVRSAFFAGDGEQVAAPCPLTLVQREGVADLVITVGSQQARLYDRPDARCQLTLRQGEPAGAKVSIRVVTGEWKSSEAPGRDWGWLRLLRAGDPRAAPEGGWLLTWPFDGTAAGGAVTWRAQAQLDACGLGEAVAGDLLTAFAVPDALLETEEQR